MNLELPMNPHNYFLELHGKIKFTKEGRARLSSLFELAGINIDDINTVGQYLQARKRASPYFMHHLASRASNWADTEQFRLLKTAVFCDDNELKQETRNFDIKNNLKIVK